MCQCQFENESIFLRGLFYLGFFSFLWEKHNLIALLAYFVATQLTGLKCLSNNIALGVISVQNKLLSQVRRWWVNKGLPNQELLVPSWCQIIAPKNENETNKWKAFLAGQDSWLPTTDVMVILNYWVQIQKCNIHRALPGVTEHWPRPWALIRQLGLVTLVLWGDCS